jgi:ubiquinone/menaquinone biosynthesis C-methylase UbiE
MDKKQQVQEQFGAHAAAYAVSAVHAKGASLGRLVELVEPQHDWLALDVATAAGHTALAFAPHVARVVATDLTPQMLPVAREQARQKGVANMLLAGADAENIPFASASFHLVTCRIAPHHFPDVARFVAEAVRVLRPGGVLAVVDNIVPGGERWRGKKRRDHENAGRYVNAFEKLRDPSHNRCLTLAEWLATFQATGLEVTAQEMAWKGMDFDDWASRMAVPAGDTLRLKVLLRQAPAIVQEFLTPQFNGERISFRLAEAIIAGRKPG